ncbi:MarR family transcriptional regulator [Lentzea sp. NPDC034063]|uniref:MarR family winged helix-turn-helix transcriptional regulator n=1 Tax=unclassified Lentzea TaxID=2643253 RepID=UPI0033F70453
MSSTGPTPGHLVWRLAMKWRTAVDRALDPLGLTHAQYVVLSSLVALDRPSQRELADHTGLEPLYVSKLARALEASGFIARTRDTVDTRTVRLTLTPHGHSTVEPAIEVVRSLLDRLLKPLGGRSGDRTEALSRELTALLDVPLD